MWRLFCSMVIHSFPATTRATTTTNWPRSEQPTASRSHKSQNGRNVPVVASEFVFHQLTCGGEGVAQRRGQLRECWQNLFPAITSTTLPGRDWNMPDESYDGNRYLLDSLVSEHNVHKRHGMVFRSSDRNKVRTRPQEALTPTRIAFFEETRKQKLTMIGWGLQGRYQWEWVMVIYGAFK